MTMVSRTTPVNQSTLTVPDESAVEPVAAAQHLSGCVSRVGHAVDDGEVLQFSRVAESYPTSLFRKILGFNQNSCGVFGCSLHDTIQPGFSFLVGVALSYSIASRIAKGARFKELFFHAMWRSLVLVALGVFLRSMDHSMTYFTFEDTLSQIGFGYPFLFVLDSVHRSRDGRSGMGSTLLNSRGILASVGRVSAAPTNFDWQSVGVPATWNAQHNLRDRRATGTRTTISEIVGP